MCLELQSYNLHVPTVSKSGSPKLLEPCGPVTGLYWYTVNSLSSDFRLTDPPFRDLPGNDYSQSKKKYNRRPILVSSLSLLHYLRDLQDEAPKAPPQPKTSLRKFLWNLNVTQCTEFLWGPIMWSTNRRLQSDDIQDSLSLVNPTRHRSNVVEARLLPIYAYIQTFICVLGLIFRFYYQNYAIYIFFFLWRCDPTRVMGSSFLRFLDHTRRTTFGRTSLDE